MLIIQKHPVFLRVLCVTGEQEPLGPWLGPWPGRLELPRGAYVIVRREF